MLNILKNIYVIGNLLGLILISIALWRFKETLKNHRKVSKDDFLSESEKIIQNKSIRILIIGFSIVFITDLIRLVLFFII